jgi:hypothetical protein
VTRARRQRAVWFVAAALAVGVLAGCGDSDDESVESGDVENVPVLDVDPADGPTCLDLPEDQGEEVEELPLVDCEQAHTHEIFAKLEYVPPDSTTGTTSDLYPGKDAIERFAEGACLREFEPFVGISFFDSELYYSWIVPSLEGWNDEDDRDVLCVISRFDGSTMEGSARGLAR